MSIPLNKNFKPDYTNMTQFPLNIYDKEKVMPLPYFKRDIVNPDHFEYIGRSPLPNTPGRWNWGQFSNGYGYGNFQGHNNCSASCGAFKSCPLNYPTQPLTINQKYDKNCLKYNPFESSVNKFCNGRQDAISCDDPSNNCGTKFISDKTLKLAQSYAKSIYYK